MIKGDLIGRGATADVYYWTDSRVIKIFNDLEPDWAIEREAENTKALEGCTFAFPHFIQRLQYEGKRAIVYERASGTSMMKLMEMEPLSYKKYARKLAQLHFEVHKNHINGIREQKPYFKERISCSKDLTDDKKNKLYGLVDSMPSDDCLCHSDFHPDNILCSQNKDYVIDWADCCSGDPCADVCRTLLTLSTADIPESLSRVKKIAVMCIRKNFSSIYIREYLRLSNKTKEQIYKWWVPVAAYRLCAARTKEKKILLNIIDSYLEKGGR